ncbi:MAG: glycoside hydrolase family 15 protein [Hyphomicrobiales bacterium]|nr:glycoside hydrolase family 15 protein [Hyphomicrobiales bacterium]
MNDGQPLDLALIGNCRVAALIDSSARVVWWCFPRFDGDPVFCRLLSGSEEKGFTDVVLHDQVKTTSSYARNTAVLETFLEDEHGAIVKITDFMPRFGRYERVFRPPQFVRRIEPVAGLPRIALRVRPAFNYGGKPAQVVIGSNHIRYVGDRDVLRLSTDAPLSFIAGETMFALTRPLTLIFGVDEPFLSEIDSTARDFETRTLVYWREWVRTLGVPFEWQGEVIRAAITLKLCSFEETGAIIAAHTTSIPEAPGTMRNWDYRFCWLRDAFFVVAALNRLGATQTMESYINYLTTVVADPDGVLSPLHSIVPGAPLDERLAENLEGFGGQGPVRIGNAAAEQAQHDGYGSVVLGAKQMFVDHRLPKMGDEALFRRLEPLGERAAKLALTPDAGIWEYRGRTRVHTYSATLCWAACDRLSQIAGYLCLPDRSAYWRDRASVIRRAILEGAWSEKRGAIVGAFGHDDLDASVLMIADLGLLPPTDPRFVMTVAAIGRELKRNGRIMRYTAADDFGEPETAFIVCNFWYADALAAIGKREQAREVFQDILSHSNKYGLLSEDIHPKTGQLWGNIPQTYSMAGVINSAMHLSNRWEDAWWRGW